MLINMDLISPAGGINSTLQDMTRWLRFLLAEGALDGRRHLDAEALRETWTVHIGKADLDGMMPGASYGLGWFIKKRNALPVLEHGGNALGYSALVALIPEEKVGFVMLSNALPNPLQFTLSEHVWAAVIPEEEE
jgi:CubicO group peptidase (beta-lactamase class C family)